MKLKHWAGYGCINARKVKSEKDLLVVEVRGEHECGLVRDDKYDVFNWLVKRFDKKHTDYMDILDMDITLDSIVKPENYSGYEDICTYSILFRN